MFKGRTYGTLPTPTKSGSTFDGWYTSASGGEKVTSSTTVTNASAHTIYAHWTPAVSYLHKDWKDQISHIDWITEISFTNDNTNLTGTPIQIGATDENSTAYWAKGNTTCYGVYAYTNDYILTIYSPVTIYAPKDSSHLFDYSSVSSTSNVSYTYFSNYFRAPSPSTDTGVATFSVIKFNGVFNTSKVENMRYMFNGCEKTTDIDVSSFDTSLVRDMTCMFYGCSSLTAITGINSWNTSNVVSMSRMFGMCSKLTSLNLNGWTTTKVQDMTAMFLQCTSLKALNLSTFVIIGDTTDMLVTCTSLVQIITPTAISKGEIVLPGAYKVIGPSSTEIYYSLDSTTPAKQNLVRV